MATRIAQTVKVTLPRRYGSGDVYQFTDRETAQAFLASLPSTMSADAEVSEPGPALVEQVEARCLWNSDVLADGIEIDRLFFGSKVRVTGLDLSGATERRWLTVRRAYDPEQLVTIFQRRPSR